MSLLTRIVDFLGKPVNIRYLAARENRAAVADHLEGLKRQGFTVMHDVTVSEVIVDHLVVGSAGVFVIFNADRVHGAWPGGGQARVARTLKTVAAHALVAGAQLRTGGIPLRPILYSNDDRFKGSELSSLRVLAPDQVSGFIMCCPGAVTPHVALEVAAVAFSKR